MYQQTTREGRHKMAIRNRERNEVSDVQEEQVPDNTETPTTEGTDAEAKKSSKAPIPEGYISPVDLAKELGIKPQMVYGYIKNMKDFPFVERGADEKPRFIVKRDEAVSFLEAKKQAKAQRDAEKAAKAAEQPAASTEDAQA
jgi:hypothetical protein